MSRRRRNRKPRGPGVYQNPDGSTTTITQHGDEIIEVTSRKAPGRPAVTMTTKSTGAPAGNEQGGLYQAPAIQTNVIPGEPPGVTIDQGTGLEFKSKSDLERYYKEHNLVDMSGREGARRLQAPSYAEQPKSSGGPHVRAYNANAGGPPEPTVGPHTIMTPEAQRRLFGGAPIKNGRRFT